YFALKRRFLSAQFLPNYNQCASTIRNSARVSRSRRAVRWRDITQEPIHREPAGRAGDANVCARDRKMVRVAAVTTGARRAFANQAGLLQEVWLVLDTLVTKAPLPGHRFHCPPRDQGRVAPARFERKLSRCVALRAGQFQQ